MTEPEYVRSRSRIDGEVDTAIECFYTELELNDLALKERAIFDKLNRDAAFWNLQRYSLQSTFFMTVGRILDVDGDALSLHKLLKAAVEHPEYFSKAALRERKVASCQGTPDWLGGFLEGVWEPEAKDLRELKTQLIPHQRKFEEVYRPIRHKVFAHNLAHEDGLSNELFEKARIPEIEQLLYFLHDLLKNLENLLYNGMKPDLGKATYAYEKRVRSNVQAVIFKVA